MELDIYLGDSVYADIGDDGLIVLRSTDGDEIFLESATQIALTGLIERRRRAEAEFELAAERMEMAD